MWEEDVLTFEEGETDFIDSLDFPVTEHEREVKIKRGKISVCNLWSYKFSGPIHTLFNLSVTCTSPFTHLSLFYTLLEFKCGVRLITESLTDIVSLV